MSFLYLQGLKQGDTQMTVFGLLIAGLFFLISQSKPLAKLSIQKPPSSVFELSVLFSIIGQCCIHISALYCTSILCSYYTVRMNTPPGGIITPDSPDIFFPNIINTAVFLVSSTIQVNNFVINYYGHPYMQSLMENTILMRTVIGIYIVLIVLVGGQLEPLNDLFQLIDFSKVYSKYINTGTSNSAEFQGYLLSIMVSTTVFAYGVDYISRKLESIPPITNNSEQLK